MNPFQIEILNRGIPPQDFIDGILAWGKTAQDDIFAPNNNFDIYNRVRPELGPWTSELHRRAVLLEVMFVLGMFESSGKWTEGVDTSKLQENTPENAEAGAWQVSYGSRKLDLSLIEFLEGKNVHKGIVFQQVMKFDHPTAMEYIARLLRVDTKDPQRLENGPLYKGDERAFIRSSERPASHSIYPWLNRDRVNLIQSLI